MLVAALVLSCAWAHAMDLRDMPDWVRDRIWPVEVDWQAMGAPPVVTTVPRAPLPANPTVNQPVPRAPSPVETGVAAPVNLGAPQVTTPGGGVTVAAPGFATGGGVTVAAPGFATGGGVHAPGFAGDATGATGVRPASAMGLGELGGVGVRLPGMGEVGVAGGVHVGAMGAEWDEALTSIEGLDRETLAQAGQILAMIRERNMSPEQFAAWAEEHGVTPEVLTAAKLGTASISATRTVQMARMAGSSWVATASPRVRWRSSAGDRQARSSRAA